MQNSYNPFDVILSRLDQIESKLPGSVANISSPPAEIVDTEELCKRLDITKPTLSAWRKKGKIPFLQIGSAIRFNWIAVLAALEIKN